MSMSVTNKGSSRASPAAQPEGRIMGPCLGAPKTFRAQNPLFQHDLFHCILDCLAPLETSIVWFKLVRPALVSLALTCRTFSEPSLNRLWYKLDSLEPLIRCYVGALDEDSAKIPPSSTGWAIIHRYSRRIRELLIHPFNNFTLHFIQASSMHPSLLVPNLRVLMWHPCMFPGSEPKLSITFIRRLLNPSLLVLSVALTETYDVALRSFLANYPLLCPNLKSVSIDLFARQNTPVETVEILSRAVSHLKHIKGLNISAPLDDIALSRIFMSPKLEKIDLILHPNKSRLHRVLIPSNAIPFCNVEDLSLEVWDLCFVTNLLRTRGQAFRSFTIKYHFQPTVGAVHDIVTALASSQRIHSLRSIHLLPSDYGVQLFESTEPDESPWHHHLTRDTFRPFAPLCHLRELEVAFCHWLPLDDDNLVSLASNWPSLRVLHLNHRSHLCTYPWRGSKYVTLQGLLSLLECCPDLRELSLPVDARVVPTNAERIVCNRALTRVHFPESPIDDERLVQYFFVRHLPSVTVVTTSFNQTSAEDDAELDAYTDSWVAVRHMLY